MRVAGLLLVLPLLGAGCSPASSAEPVADVGAEVSTVTADVARVEDELVIDGGVVAEATDVVIDPVVNAVEMQVGNFFFDGDRLVATPGQEVVVRFTHVAGDHTFVIDELDLSYAVEPGGSLVFTAPKTPGTYTYYCDVGSHQKLGMEGVLIVE